MPKGSVAVSESQVKAEIAEKVGLSKKQINEVFEALGEVVEKHIKKGATVKIPPGLVKLEIKHKDARPAGSRPDPFHKGEIMKIKAKPTPGS